MCRSRISEEDLAVGRGLFMTDLALEPDMRGTIRLYDIDKKAAEANKIIGNQVTARDDVGKWEYEAYDSIRTALDGADFVVLSILPGTFDEMAVDVHMPERLGIYQSVGAPPGTGGMCVRSVRSRSPIKVRSPRRSAIMRRMHGSSTTPIR